MTFQIHANSEVAITEMAAPFPGGPRYKVVVFNIQQATFAMEYLMPSHKIYAMDESEMRIASIYSVADAIDFYNKTGMFAPHVENP